MEIEYRNKSIEKVCTKVAVAEKKYGSAMAEKIQLRIEQISATPNIEYLIQYHSLSPATSQSKESICNGSCPSNETCL